MYGWRYLAPMGATDQIIIKEALAEGHQVTAVTRQPEQFEEQLRGELGQYQAGDHAQLRLVHADVYNPPSVEAAIVSQDAVLCLVSEPFSWKPISVYSQAASEQRKPP